MSLISSRRFTERCRIVIITALYCTSLLSIAHRYVVLKSYTIRRSIDYPASVSRKCTHAHSRLFFLGLHPKVSFSRQILQKIPHATSTIGCSVKIAWKRTLIAKCHVYSGRMTFKQIEARPERVTPITLRRFAIFQKKKNLIFPLTCLI